jgi:hypothetical protein
LRFLTIGIFSVLMSQAFSIGAVPTGTDIGAPPVIIAGLKAYESGGPEGAIKAWLKGSPIEGAKEAITLVTSLRGIEDLLGKYQSSRIAKRLPFAPDCELTYVQMNYAKGPLFAKFLTYRIGQDWVVEILRFHSDPDQVWPWELLSPSPAK